MIFEKKIKNFECIFFPLLEHWPNHKHVVKQTKIGTPLLFYAILYNFSRYNYFVWHNIIIASFPLPVLVTPPLLPRPRFQSYYQRDKVSFKQTSLLPSCSWTKPLVKSGRSDKSTNSGQNDHI